MQKSIRKLTPTHLFNLQNTDFKLIKLTFLLYNFFTRDFQTLQPIQPELWNKQKQ
ncbi:hypothetical protein SAMN05444267_101381 [Chryseobacterium polytrichastri]|uniref:Uncharacterized protein n=1 Tax=Chryseobacterium polytrichastri TaxID=1302687 RepID=A0A1M6YL68_9FLAO|nr:hypothetical protein SAMN05444267_101381 [Chryseobacterium polytrichastri]